MRTVHLFALFAVLVLVSSGAGVYATAVPSPAAAATPFASAIDHVVIIMMENRAYDNYFETYCLHLTAVCKSVAHGVAPGTCVPQLNVSGGCVVPIALSVKQLSTPDLPHEYTSTIRSIDGGKENGYYTAEGKTRETFDHYNGSTIPIYWDMAQEFELGDNFYSSALSYSLPNHWYLLAGQSPPVAFDSDIRYASVATKHVYLNESNSTRTVEDLFNNSGVSWRYYDAALTSYQVAIQPGTVEGRPPQAIGVGPAYGLWNPLAARAESYDNYFDDHFVNRTQIFSDLQDGNLPNVSYVIPQANYSDHAPANISLGESFVANVVDAVEFSPYWNHTAIFLMWDDYGGWFDNQPPPQLDPLGLSSRVPFIVISPYTPAGRVNHALGYFESTLAFIEYRWGLHKDCLTARDCGAPNLAGFFDFSMTPRAPVYFDPNWLNDTYPYHHETYHAGQLDTTSWTGNDDDLTEDEAD